MYKETIADCEWRQKLWSLCPIISTNTWLCVEAIQLCNSKGNIQYFNLCRTTNNWWVYLSNVEARQSYSICWKFWVNQSNNISEIQKKCYSLIAIFSIYFKPSSQLEEAYLNYLYNSYSQESLNSVCRQYASFALKVRSKNSETIKVFTPLVVSTIKVKIN